ncbi:MAG: hypothetical protein U0802_00910 [Candidatus Binatia bacterium]
MRFVVTGEWTRNRLLKVIVWCFLAYTLVLWVTNGALYFAKMNLTPGSVIEYYRGNEEKFLQPRSAQGLLETLHFHAFAMGILLVTLTHLVLFVPISMRTKAIGIAIAFTSGLLGELSSWGVRFVHPAFAYLKIACFLLLEGAILWLVIAVGRALLTKAPSAYTQGQGPPVRPVA